MLKIQGKVSALCCGQTLLVGVLGMLLTYQACRVYRSGGRNWAVHGEGCAWKLLVVLGRVQIVVQSNLRPHLRRVGTLNPTNN